MLGSTDTSVSFPASWLPSLPAFFLRHITFNINRLFFPDVVPFAADIRDDAGILVEAIFLIFTPVVN